MNPLLIALPVLAAGYAAWLAVAPYGPHRRCAGRAGKGIGSTSRAWNHCRCRGGEVTRLGATTVRRMIGMPLPREHWRRI
jgi:hypothetical protein